MRGPWQALAILVSVCAILGACSGGVRAQAAEREIETAALYLPKLGAEPGQRLKTRTTIGCYRNAAKDYRCIILGLRMQGAMVITKTIDPDAQAYLDRYCRGRNSGLDYQECRFRLAFDLVSESFDQAESMRIYQAQNMSLESDFLRGVRNPPSRN